LNDYGTIGEHTVMRIRLTLALLALSACPALAVMTADMYLSDGNTPLALHDPTVPHVYRDIMVGTKLCAIVSSEKKTKLTGEIFTSWIDYEKAELAARGFDDFTLEWKGSCLPAAGSTAYVGYFENDSDLGFRLKTGGAWLSAGQWFIFDYRAKDIGTCAIILREVSSAVTPDPVVLPPDPNASPPAPGAVVTTLTLNHVPSRDFNRDTIVNFRDFALFAERWRTEASPDPNGSAGPFDLDGDGYTSISDMALLSQFWLDRTDITVPIPDPNAPFLPLQP
jgi:hypothetical protein